MLFRSKRVLNRINPKRTTSRHIVIKKAKIKDKERILKAAREKQKAMSRGTPIKLSANFSAETLLAKRKWHDILKVLEGENLQPRILYSTRLSFKTEEEIK